MSDPDFPNGVREVIRGCVPNIDAAELLLLLAQHVGRDFDPSEMVATMPAAQLTEAAARNYLAQFESCGLATREGDRYRFAPKNARSREAVEALGRLYRERPVSLVRVIYALRDERIRAFADAFKLKNE